MLQAERRIILSMIYSLKDGKEESEGGDSEGPLTEGRERSLETQEGPRDAKKLGNRTPPPDEYISKP
jgi:hypothetical protein